MNREPVHPSLQSLQAVIFDFDGTLVDSNSIKRRAFFEVAENSKIPEALMTEVLDTPELGDRTQLFRHLADRTHRSPEWARESEAMYTRLCDERIAAAPEIPGASKVLSALRERSIPAYLCSNTPAGPLLSVVKKRKIDGFFRRVVGGPTPKVENTRALLAADHLEPSKVLCVGDTEVDRAAAVTCGCFYAGLTNPFSSYTEPLSWNLDRVDDLFS